MTKASINFKPVKANSKIHNERIHELDYVFSDLTSKNEIWKSAEIPDRKKEIERLCKNLSGRKMQKNATPIREAVVNLSASHTLADLQQLSKTLKEQKGIECFQIFIHRDEGFSRDKLNYHAHMLFDWQDKSTGKMLRLNKLDMSQIQTIVSQGLGMERGELKVNSNRQRLEPVEYKRQREEEKLQALQKQIQALEQKKNRAAKANKSAREKHEGVKSSYGVSEQRTRDWATKGIQEYSSSLRRENKGLSRAIEWQRAHLENYEEEIRRHEKAYQIASKDQDSFAENIKLRDLIPKQQEAIAKLRSKIESIEAEIEQNQGT